MTDNAKPIMAIDRIKGLTDGVLAIVLTILVLSFEVPDHEFSRDGVLSFLVKLREPLLAYVVSFGIVATYWVQHSAVFHFLRVGNRTLLWLNMLFMLPVTLLPFLTDLRAQYHSEYRVTMLYASANVVSGLCLLAIWRYAVRQDLTIPLSPGVDASMSRRILLGVGINIAGAAIAVFDTYLASICFMLLPVIYLSHAVVDRAWVRERAKD